MSIYDKYGGLVEMKLFKKFKEQLDDKKKKQEHEKLIQALKQPEIQRKRPAVKFANKTMNGGPG